MGRPWPEGITNSHPPNPSGAHAASTPTMRPADSAHRSRSPREIERDVVGSPSVICSPGHLRVQSNPILVPAPSQGAA